MSTQTLAILALVFSTASSAINFGLLVRKLMGSRLARLERRLGVDVPPEPDPRIVHVDEIEEIRLRPR